MYYVYILQCAEGSYYIGTSTDVEARVKEHNTGTKAACHTFLRRPVTLVYTESFATQLDAMKRERQLKNWSHAKKAALINRDQVALKALSKRRKP